jgi:2-dehydropantoate 2-reductase
VPVLTSVAELAPTADDVVLLAVKSQDTSGVLHDLVGALAQAGRPGVPIVCLQNGVANERTALRWFADVYAVTVMAPTEHMRPGVVRTYATPVPGILDLGRWPSGVDERGEEIAAAFRSAGFESDAVADVSRGKHRKLIMNLTNAAEALCGPDARAGELADRAQAEGEAVLAAAGIDVASNEEDLARRGSFLRIRPVAGERRIGGSTWQSLRRGTGAVEVDYLNGEIVLLGRLHGVATPVNALLQRLTNEAAVAGTPPAAMTEAEVLALLS